MDRAFRAIRRCDVVALVIDAVDGITQQDFRCCCRSRCLRSSSAGVPFMHEGLVGSYV